MLMTWMKHHRNLPPPPLRKSLSRLVPLLSRARQELTFPARLYSSGATTPFSAASVANAAVFVPTFTGGATQGGSSTPGGSAAMGVGAQEFVPRRTET